MHFHVINPDQDARRRINRLRATYKNVGFSVEHCKNPQKAYYASSRFLIAPQVIKAFQKPMFIFDIDVRFNRNLDELFTQGGWDRDTIGVRHTDDLSLPWQKMTANAMYLPLTEYSLLYSEKIRDFLLPWFYDAFDGRDLWWIDQNAIFFALLEMMKCKGFDFQVWGERLNYLQFPRLFEERDKALSAR
jgi:hypothetical protein